MLFTTTHRYHIYLSTWTSILTSSNSHRQSADASSTSSTTSLLPIRPIASAATCCCPSHTPTTTRSGAKTLTSRALISLTTSHLFLDSDSLKLHLNKHLNYTLITPLNHTHIYLFHHIVCYIFTSQIRHQLTVS